ncbi:hypothetical protein EV122DRAFT_210238 [Schizophyllum commune]
MADVEAPPAKVPRTRSPSPLSAEAALESEAPVAARQFSDETWAEIMLHCSIFDLFCLRDTCHRFRMMIDREMLEEALVDAGMSRIFPQREQEREYLPICGTWSTLPPASSDLKIRLCGSTDCSSYMFSHHMSRGWKFCRKPGTDYTYYDDVVEFVLPPAAEMWQPHMLMDIGCYVNDWHYAVFQDINGSTNCRAVLKARLQAKKELDSIGWKGDVHSDIMKDSKDKTGAKRLAAVYLNRKRQHEITCWASGSIYCIYLIWRIRNEEKCTKVRQDNLQAIEATAKSYNQPYSLNHPVIQRVLEAHARDVSIILPPAARSLFPLPDVPATPWNRKGHHPSQQPALCQTDSTPGESASGDACTAALGRAKTTAGEPAQATPRPLAAAYTTGTILWNCTHCAGKALFTTQWLLMQHKRDVYVAFDTTVMYVD